MHLRRAALLAAVALCSLAAGCGTTPVEPAASVDSLDEAPADADADAKAQPDVGDSADTAEVPDVAQDASPEVASVDATLDALVDAGEVQAGCEVAGCAQPDAVCMADGSCCQPQCQDQCGGLANGCGGACTDECAGVCTVPAVAPTPLYRAWSFKPNPAVAPTSGCPLALGAGPGDGTHVTDFGDTAAFAQGNVTALAFAADALIGVTKALGLLAGAASGAGCASGMQGCQIKLWSAAFNPHGLPGACPARALLLKDKAFSEPTFRQDAASPVPSFVPLFLFAGPVESLAPWVRVHRLLATPATNASVPGVFCGVVRRVDLEAALAKLSATQAGHPSVAQVKNWFASHDTTFDSDGDDEPDAWPFSFTLGIALAGPSTVAK